MKTTPYTTAVVEAFSNSHAVTKDIEGRASNFKKPTDISRFPCIIQWDVLTDEQPGFCV